MRSISSGGKRDRQHAHVADELIAKDADGVLDACTLGKPPEQLLELGPQGARYFAAAESADRHGTAETRVIGAEACQAARIRSAQRKTETATVMCNDEASDANASWMNSRGIYIRSPGQRQSDGRLVQAPMLGTLRSAARKLRLNEPSRHPLRIPGRQKHARVYGVMKRGFQLPAKRGYGFPALLELVHKDGLALRVLAGQRRDVIFPFEKRCSSWGILSALRWSVLSVLMPENRAA